MFPGLGVDPQRIAEMQTVSKFIFAKIRVDYAVNTASVELSSAVPAAAALIPELLEQFAPSLAQQFATMFAIQGEIIEVNKPSEQG